MYDFSILKVMTVCINVYAGLCDVFRFSITDLSQADFVKSTAYLIHYWHTGIDSQIEPYSNPWQLVGVIFSSISNKTKYQANLF